MLARYKHSTLLRKSVKQKGFTALAHVNWFIKIVRLLTYVRFLKPPPKLPPGAFPAATRTASLAALVATKAASWCVSYKSFFSLSLMSKKQAVFTLVSLEHTNGANVMRLFLYKLELLTR